MRITRHLVLGLTAALAASAPALPRRDGDDAADAILRLASAAMHGLESYRLDLNVDVLTEAEGEREHARSAYRVAAARPNRLAVVLGAGELGATVVCDGRTMTTFIPPLGRYTVEDAPPGLEEIAAQLREVDPIFGLAEPADFGALLFAPDLREPLLDGAESLAHAGPEMMDGVRCDVVSFTKAGAEWRIWFEAGDRPVPRRAVVDLSAPFREAWMLGEDARFVLTVRFNAWQFDPEIPDAAFAFVPPAGAERVETLFDDLEAADEEPGPHPLLGRAAPPFILDALDGDPVALGVRPGGGIVVLDFWATWCVPCVRALPVLIEATDEYRDRGVRFFAVNVAEDPQDVRAFLERQKLAPTVLLDTEGRAATEYAVDAFPQTVLIGKDGRIQSVHVGFDPDAGARLRREIDALLAGEDLLAEAAPEAAAPEGLDPPIDWSKGGAYTMRQYEQEGAARDRSQFLDAYQRIGSRSDEWDQDAIEFLERMALDVNSASGAPSANKIIEAGDTLAERGCDDPLVLLGLGMALDTQRHKKRAEDPLRKAVAGLQERGYPAVWQAIAASSLAVHLDAWERGPEAREFHERAVAAFAQAAAESAPGDWYGQRAITNRLGHQVGEFLPEDLAAALVDRLAADETLDPCTVGTLRGVLEIRAAWSERGSGFANTVTEKGWEGLERHMLRAREHLEEAYRLDPTRPEAATAMITVAMAGHARQDETERLWFERAIEGQIDWHQAYSNLRWSMRPRWGGSFELMYRFGLECVRSGRYDTLVPYQLIRALLDIAQDSDDTFDFWVQRDVYPAARETLDALAADPANAEWARGFRATQAAFAWATGHEDDARTMIAAIGGLGGDHPESDLSSIGVTSRRITDDVLARTSAGSDRVKAADLAMKWGRPEPAVDEYEAVLSETTDPALVEVLRDRLFTARLFRDFMSGEWVPLTFERGFPGWRVERGVWHASTPESIKGGPNVDGLKIICQAPIGERFELEGTIETSKLTGSKANAGVLFRMRCLGDRPEWQAFRVQPREGKVSIGEQYLHTAQSIPLGSKTQHTFHFHLSVWDEHAVLQLGRHVLFSGRVPCRPDARLGPLLALGGAYGWYGGYVTYSDLRLRRLVEPPEPLRQLVGWQEQKR